MLFFHKTKSFGFTRKLLAYLWEDNLAFLKKILFCKKNYSGYRYEKKKHFYKRSVFQKRNVIFYRKICFSVSVLDLDSNFYPYSATCESRSVLVFRIWIHTINNESWYFLRSVNYPQQQHVTCECVGTVSRIDCQTWREEGSTEWGSHVVGSGKREDTLLVLTGIRNY